MECRASNYPELYELIRGASSVGLKDISLMNPQVYEYQSRNS